MTLDEADDVFAIQLSLYYWNDESDSETDLWKRIINIIIDKHNSSLLGDNEQLRSALNYITQPTMGFPGGDAEAFAKEGATEANARAALATCIRIAKQALGEGPHHTPVYDALQRTLQENEQLKAELAEYKNLKENEGADE